MGLTIYRPVTWCLYIRIVFRPSIICPVFVLVAPLIGLIGVCWMGHVTLYGNCVRKHSQCTCRLETDSSNHIALQKILLCLGLSYFKSPGVPLPLTIAFQSTSLFLCPFLSILLFDHHCHSRLGEHMTRPVDCTSTCAPLWVHLERLSGKIKSMRSSVFVCVCVLRAGIFEYRWLHLVIWPDKASCHSCAVTYIRIKWYSSQWQRFGRQTQALYPIHFNFIQSFKNTGTQITD